MANMELVWSLFISFCIFFLQSVETLKFPKEKMKNKTNFFLPKTFPGGAPGGKIKTCFHFDVSRANRLNILKGYVKTASLNYI